MGAAPGLQPPTAGGEGAGSTFPAACHYDNWDSHGTDQRLDSAELRAGKVREDSVVSRVSDSDICRVIAFPPPGTRSPSLGPQPCKQQRQEAAPDAAVAAARWHWGDWDLSPLVTTSVQLPTAQRGQLSMVIPASSLRAGHWDAEGGHPRRCGLGRQRHLKAVKS